jgi:hypothetical protein
MKRVHGMNTQKWNLYNWLLYHFQVHDQYHNFQVFIHGVFGLHVCKLYSYMERCLIWILYLYTIFVLHAVWMNTTKYEIFWEKLVCATAGCCFVLCTAARRCRFSIRDCQRTGQWDARTRYVEDHHPSRLLHVHALHLEHTKRWATFSLLLIWEAVGHRLIKFVSRSELLGLGFVAQNSTCEELNLQKVV